MEQNPRNILNRAVFCDRKQRFLEAECLYRQGTDILLDIADEEPDFRVKRTIYDRVAQYMDRSKQLQVHLKQTLSRGDKVISLNLNENDRGKSYHKLFDAYMSSTVKEVIVEEPCLTEPSHFHNLIVFFETLIKSCPNLKYIRLITKPGLSDERSQLKILDEIRLEVNSLGITLHTHFDQTLNSPRIVLDNGYIIRSSRGIHYFKELKLRYSLGVADYDFRRCLQTEVDVWRTKNKHINMNWPIPRSFT